MLNIDVTSIDAEYSSNQGVLTAAFPNYLVASVLKNNVYADGLGFVFNTSVEQFFKSLRDNVGGFIFAQEMNRERHSGGLPLPHHQPAGNCQRQDLHHLWQLE